MLISSAKFPVQRARMRVRLTIPAADVEKLEARIRECAEVVEGSEKRDELWETVSDAFPFFVNLILMRDSTQTLQIDPAQFRVFKELLDKECKLGRLDVVDHTVFAPPAAT